jgi:hypothetical protein
MEEIINKKEEENSKEADSVLKQIEELKKKAKVLENNKKHI